MGTVEEESPGSGHRRTPHFLAWQREKQEVAVPGSQDDHLGTLVISEGR